MIDSLDSFVDEMLCEETPKVGMLEDMLSLLGQQPIPSLEQVQADYDLKTNFHGLIFDYQNEDVTIHYLVVPHLYEPRTISFKTFEVLVEGVMYCQRKYKW